jgi:hypothetical protein
VRYRKLLRNKNKNTIKNKSLHNTLTLEVLQMEETTDPLEIEKLKKVDAIFAK